MSDSGTMSTSSTSTDSSRIQKCSVYGRRANSYARISVAFAQVLTKTKQNWNCVHVFLAYSYIWVWAYEAGYPTPMNAICTINTKNMAVKISPKSKRERKRRIKTKICNNAQGAECVSAFSYTQNKSTTSDIDVLVSHSFCHMLKLMYVYSLRCYFSLFIHFMWGWLHSTRSHW